MKVPITQLTTGLAVAALIALPASAAAQTQTGQSPQQPPAAQAPATSGSATDTAAQTPQDSSAAAREHLAKAKAALADVNTSTLTARTKSQITELNRRMNALERSVSSETGAAASAAQDKAEWGSELAAIDKTLTTLLGPESANSTGTPSAVGTSGATSAVDEATRAKLMEVRSHLTSFAAAMAGGNPKTPAPDPTTDPSAAPQPPTPMGTSGNTQTADTQTPPETAAQPDEQAARHHLTEARNTLSAITQLPQAAQLTGDTRTQVSQLISNFNELITSQSDWRGAYAKVSANLNALIGAESGATTDPTVSGTAGAVGTSGNTTLDPEIRTRLVELRRQLNEFEKSAGSGAAPAPGAATAPSPTTEPNAPASSGPPSGSTAPSTPPPTATPPATAPPASSATSGSQPMSGATGTSGTTESGAQAAANADVMRHIAAIEALLKSEDDSGGITLTKAQLEQLRAHLASLRQALNK